MLINIMASRFIWAARAVASLTCAGAAATAVTLAMKTIDSEQALWRLLALASIGAALLSAGALARTWGRRTR